MARDVNRTRTAQARVEKHPNKNGRVGKGKTQRSEWPLLAQNPWVGYGPALLSLLGFLWLTWAAVITQGGKALAWDAALGNQIFQWAKTQPQPVVLFMRFWSAVGRDVVALAGLILAGFWIKQKARRLLWMLIFGFFGAELWFQITSNLIGRARPEYKDPYEKLINAGYPSGHMTTNIVLGMIILYLLLPVIRSPLRKALFVIGVVLVVALIGFSRLFLGLHYPTDILGGILLGLAWGLFVLTITEWWFYRKGHIYEERDNG
jgi:membrane-associated phospholipid phosphatase